MNLFNLGSHFTVLCIVEYYIQLIGNIPTFCELLNIHYNVEHNLKQCNLNQVLSISNYLVTLLIVLSKPHFILVHTFYDLYKKYALHV